MLAAALFVAGLVTTAVAVGALAGPWWGILLGGLLLAALGVLTDLGSKRSAGPGGGESREAPRRSQARAGRA